MTHLNWRALLLSLFITQAGAAPPYDAKVASEFKDKLNSERIEYFFGSYGVNSLKKCHSSDQEIRVSELFSGQENQRVVRTLALTEFEKNLNQQILPTHEKVLSGASIGATFKKDGWLVQKQSVYFGEIVLNESLVAKMNAKSSKIAAIHIYKMYLSRSGKGAVFPYATISEIHSPEYLDLAWLKLIYGDLTKEKSLITSEVKEILRKINFCLQIVPSSSK